MILCKTPGGRPVEYGSWWQHQNPKRPTKLKARAYEAKKDYVLFEVDPAEKARVRFRWVKRSRLMATAGYFECAAPSAQEK